MLRALLIGCGNIGAFYDFNDEEGKVHSHAKAYHLLKNIIDLTITDNDSEKVNLVKNKYHFKSRNEDLTFNSFDIISLTIPTVTHFDYLKKMMEQNVPLIFCEKPIAVSIDELLELQRIRKHSISKIVVNYIRRFNPNYFSLKEYISKTESKEKLKSVTIKYCRGFLNNGSHALDIIQFLFQQAISLSELQISNKVYDTFDTDPTVSGSFTFNNATINLVGLTDISYRIFEIELFFTDKIIQITNSGNEIKVLEYKTEFNQLVLNDQLHFQNSLDKYMVDVFNFGIKLFENENFNDNFDDSISLNIEMSKALKKS
jgi:predicted dehydrogenase